MESLLIACNQNKMIKINGTHHECEHMIDDQCMTWWIEYYMMWSCGLQERDNVGCSPTSHSGFVIPRTPSWKVFKQLSKLPRGYPSGCTTFHASQSM